ncbi:MAG: hypothetical protein AM325_003365 [Candidatus Thorarchaeota archaeon SMTZ1-45]|nr:MAG: hypothetical protein AM325_05140 [Candidatus Thorarchaeota archaeon SMTZ1-45]
MSIRVLTLVLFCSILLVQPHPILSQNQTGLPEFLDIGSYAQYKQEFSNDETHELYWKIKSVEPDTIEIEIRSHGLIFNSTTDSFAIVPGGGKLIVDRDSLFILNAFHPNGSEIDGYPVNKKIAFWISTKTNESTPINTMYETNEYPVSVGPLEFDCLPTTRICWLTENVYSVGNQMNRYYDQQTGIVLMIETNRSILNAEISVLETLNDTNILPLIESWNDFDWELSITLLAISIVGITLLVAVFYHRRR